MGHMISGRVGTAIDAHTAQEEEEGGGPVGFQGSADQANSGYNLKKDNRPGLYGITPDKNECKCAPGTIEEGPSLRERMGSSQEAMNATFAVYLQAKKKVERHLIPILTELEAEQHKYDKALYDLKGKAEHAEQLSEQLGRAYMAMHDAYGEGNCKGVTREAHANEEPEPLCSEQLKEAHESITTFDKENPSTCQAGAVTLIGIRGHAVAPEVVAGEVILGSTLFRSLAPNSSDLPIGQQGRPSHGGKVGQNRKRVLMIDKFL